MQHHRASLLVQVQADNKMKLGIEQVKKGGKRQLVELLLVTPSAPPLTQFSNTETSVALYDCEVS
jgi:hypothetical protein